MARVAGDDTRVSSMELFFDLVFVFTLTQLTPMLEHDLSWLGFARTVLLVSVLWFMYGGYAWLTNSLAPLAPRSRVVLLVGMGSFFVCALAVPGAFDGDGVVFALAYLLVVCVHLGLFLTSDDAASRVGMMRLAPWSLAGVVLLVGGALTTGVWHWLLWIAMPVLAWTRGTIVTSSFRLRPGHFVERHGLLLLIALGETVVVVGQGAAGPGLEVSRVLLVVGVLVVLTALYWSHFGETGRVEAAMAAVPAERRAFFAILGYGWGFLPVLTGIIVLAAGSAEAVLHPTEHAHTEVALALGGGVALYLLGDLVLRLVAGLRPIVLRVGAGVLALGTTVLGTAVSPLVQIAALAVVLTTTLVAEYHVIARHTAASAVPA